MQTDENAAPSPLLNPTKGCPPASATYTFAPNACISGTPCSQTHCSCSNHQLNRGRCSGTAAACVAAATKSCAADASCHTFAVQSSHNCPTGKAVMWETYRFGGLTSAVPNAWSAPPPTRAALAAAAELPLDSSARRGRTDADFRQLEREDRAAAG